MRVLIQGKGPLFPVLHPVVFSPSLAHHDFRSDVGGGGKKGEGVEIMMTFSLWGVRESEISTQFSGMAQATIFPTQYNFLMYLEEHC